jgi:hypothetical protein
MSNRHAPITPKSQWLTVLVVFSLPLAVYFAVGVYYAGFGDKRYCRHKKGVYGKLACGVTLMYEVHTRYFRSLPSDEEMISHFYEHKEDFERLVRIYREDLSVPADVVGRLLPTPQVKALMNRIGVMEVNGDGSVWLPPYPYSNKPDAVRRMARLMSRGCCERRLFSGIIFSYAHPPVKRFRYLAYVYKGYYYTPFVPEVGRGRLWTPHGAERIL